MPAMLDNPSANIKNDSTCRFALLCTLFLLTAVWLEPHLGPLNRANAYIAGQILASAGFPALVTGDLISVGNFPVQIVTECTSLYAFLLLASFMFASQAPWHEKIVGIIVGGAFLSAVNLLRIAGVTIVGVSRPVLFELVHVYLGQVLMVVLVVGCCLVWGNRNAISKTSCTGFVFRCLIWGVVLAILWLVMNVSYIKILDIVVARLFALAGYRLFIPYQHAVYYQTFNIVLFAALVLADQKVSSRRRWLFGSAGLLALMGMHLLFRICNVMISAFAWHPALPLSSLLSIFGQYLLPILIWNAIRQMPEE